METIWYKDRAGAFRDDRLGRFIPMPNTPFTNQLNALFRLSVYYAIAVIVTRRTVLVLYVPLVTAAITYLLHVHETSKSLAVERALEGMNVVQDRRNGEHCTRPTRANPFMNVLMSDYAGFPERPRACDISNDAVGERVTDIYNDNSYRDSDDVYERNTGLRQFYTTASSTIPNDQETFAKWLYGIENKTCKEGNGEICSIHTFKYVPDT